MRVIYYDNYTEDYICEKHKEVTMEEEVRYYNVTAHKIVLLVWLIIIAGISILIFSMCVAGIEYVFRSCADLWSQEPEKGKLNLGVLPDFLGGMTGIIVGFFLEWFVFEKIKTLSKYQTVLSCLKIEFDKIIITINKETREISEIILDDIVLSADNSIILYNLPRYFIFLNKGKGEILSLLQEIHGNVQEYNRKGDAAKDFSKEKEKILSDITKFRKMTMWEYYREK